MFRSAKGPSRRLDSAVAEVLGWSRRFEIKVDSETGEQKRVQKKLWLVPSGDDEQRVPDYSSDAQAAYALVNEVSKGAPCALTIVDGVCRAQIWNDEFCEGSDAAMVICVAALQHMSIPSE